MSYSTDEIAKAARTTIRAVRLWDRQGLFGVVPRGENDERLFSEDHIKHAKVISAAQMAGMSLLEIKAANDVELYDKVTEAVHFMETAIWTKEFDL